MSTDRKSISFETKNYPCPKDGGSAHSVFIILPHNTLSSPNPLRELDNVRTCENNKKGGNESPIM